MSESFEKLIEGKRSFVFLGEAGCGKSEAALNLAVMLSKRGAVDFFDLDQTKPLYRSRDAREVMSDNGIRFNYEEQFFDAPTLVGGVAHSLSDGGRYTILDVGGSDTGARLIGGFAPFMGREDVSVFYMVNPYRPWSKDVISIDCTMSAILRVTRIKKISVIANPSMGHKTTAEEFSEGLRLTREMLEEYIPVDGACVRDGLYAQVKDKTNLPLLPMKMYLTYDFEEE